MVNYLCIFEDITMSNTMIPLIYLYMIGLLLFLCSKYCVCSFQFNKNSSTRHCPSMSLLVMNVNLIFTSRMYSAEGLFTVSPFLIRTPLIARRCDLCTYVPIRIDNYQVSTQVYQGVY